MSDDGKNEMAKPQLPTPMRNQAPAVSLQRAVALGAAAMGTLALGALAVDVMAIGRLAIGQLVLGRVALQRGKVNDLRIGRKRPA